MTASRVPTGPDRALTIGGVTLRYSAWGDPDNEPVLLVHGLNTERHQWDPIAEELSDEFFVVCPDLRGHGDSSWAADGYHMASFVEDLRAFSEQLGILPYHFVGHSLGARIGIAYGGEHGGTLRSLVLSDSGPEISRSGALAIRERQAKIRDKRGFRDREEVLAFIQELQPHWQPRFHELYAEHQVRLNWAGKLIHKADPELLWITGSISLKDVPRLWELAHAIPVPTLIMWGRTSTVVDEDLATRMHEAIPGSQVRVFETGHYIPREQPEQFVAALRAYFRGGE